MTIKLLCLVLKVLQNTFLIVIDNTTAISYINQFGGVQHPHLHKITKNIWQWCEQWNIFVFASYINTKDNI